MAGTSLTQLGPSTDPATLGLSFDDEVRRYHAPEAVTLPRLPGHQLDVFSLGALAYRIFAGRDPAATPEELLAAVTDGGLHLDAVADGMPYARTLEKTWRHVRARYDRPESRSSVGGGTRMVSTLSPMLGPDAAAEAHGKLSSVIERRGFLVVLASLMQPPARCCSPRRCSWPGTGRCG